LAGVLGPAIKAYFSRRLIQVWMLFVSGSFSNNAYAPEELGYRLYRRQDLTHRALCVKALGEHLAQHFLVGDIVFMILIIRFLMDKSAIRIVNQV